MYAAAMATTTATNTTDQPELIFEQMKDWRKTLSNFMINRYPIILLFQREITTKKTKIKTKKSRKNNTNLMFIASSMHSVFGQMKDEKGKSDTAQRNRRHKHTQAINQQQQQQQRKLNVLNVFWVVCFVILYFPTFLYRSIESNGSGWRCTR